MRFRLARLCGLWRLAPLARLRRVRSAVPLFLMVGVMATYYVHLTSQLTRCTMARDNLREAEAYYDKVARGNRADSMEASDQDEPVEPPKFRYHWEEEAEWELGDGDPTPEPGRPPTLGLILAYQRTGSTLVGNLLNVHPGVFYLYEPLDAVYTAMYGTQPGWNVPTDITTFSNGSERVIPDDEMKNMLRMLDAAWNCDLRQLPTAYLINTFWFKFYRQVHKLKPYLQCLEEAGLNQSTISLCRERTIGSVCPYRFSGESNDTVFCKESLQRLGRNDSSTQSSSTSDEPFRKFHACVEQYRQAALACLPHYERMCRNRTLRVIKTVRATMDVARHFLRTYSNVKVVHLVRDPRGVVRSRREMAWSQGEYDHSEGGDFYGRAAAVYCDRVHRDDVIRRQLERQYPDRVKVMTYDDLVRDPTLKLAEIYSFFDYPAPNMSHVFTRQHIKDLNANLTNLQTVLGNVAFKWQDNLTYHELKAVSKHCKPVYETLPFNLDDT